LKLLNLLRHTEVRIQPAWLSGFELNVTQADRSVRGSQCGREDDCGQETLQPQQRRSFSWESAAVSAEEPESELSRHLKEMNFLPRKTIQKTL
jgi:hypothetical protein